jgi:hypothetical protein
MPKRTPAQKKSKPTIENILFIGNSFTQRNNLPALIAGLAAEANIEVTHDLISAGGASLRTHWNAGHAAKAIASKSYDYVVLQEQSTLPIKNPERMKENIRLFDAAIQTAGAKTVLYTTWARQHSLETQKQITTAYSEIGKELGALVIPVGPAWMRFLAKHDEPNLYDKDQSHPTLAGSYLAACVFLAALFKTNPTGTNFIPSGLSKEAAKALQTIAWKECSKR